MTWWLHGLSLLLLATIANGQMATGARVPAEPLPLLGEGELLWQGEAVPPVTVLSFHSSLAAARSHSGLLRRLAATHPRDLRVVVIAPIGPDEAPAETFAGLAVVPDGDGTLRSSWLGGQTDCDMFLVRAGRVVWQGAPEYGLRNVTERALRGGLEAEVEARWASVRRSLQDAFIDAKGETLRSQAQKLLDHEPTDGFAWGVLYLAYAERLMDPAAAASVLQRAVLVLTDVPHALAAFADLTLRGSPHDRALGRELVPPLTVAALTFREDLQLQLVRLRALVRGGGGSEVGRASRELLRHIDEAKLAVELVEILTKDRRAHAYHELCQRALTLAEKRGVRPRALQACRHAVALHVHQDREHATQLAEHYFQSLGGRVQLNNEAWYLMTRRATRGRFDGFALAMVESMLEQRSTMDYFEFDTAALAMYLAGRVEEAVALQGIAIDRGGRSNPAYQERLQRYRASAGAVPR